MGRYPVGVLARQADALAKHQKGELGGVAGNYTDKPVDRPERGNATGLAGHR